VREYVIDKRCFECFENGYKRLFEKYCIDPEKRKEFLSILATTINNSKSSLTPEIQRNLNRQFLGMIEMKDPFLEEKRLSNNVALALYDEWKPKVLLADDPFDLALRLAIAGNIMDYGASGNFDIHSTIEKALSKPLAIDHSHDLKEKIEKAQSIIYLGDNAGEIVFDKLFIETIGHKNVTFVVRSAPILNDVTIDDAKDTGIEKVAEIISSGYDAPSTILYQSGEHFLSKYMSADLIISKGQGNLEGLLFQDDPRIFFLLMAKCDVIAEMLKVEKGSFLVYNVNGK
jgi:uncharacterized protein with ATP-grasp and redox domains